MRDLIVRECAEKGAKTYTGTRAIWKVGQERRLLFRRKYGRALQDEYCMSLRSKACVKEAMAPHIVEEHHHAGLSAYV